MPSNTPVLGLYKKDPATDGNDTFNIETMLNQNWDKLDANAARPFYLKSVSYDTTNDRIVCILAPGLAELFSGDTRVIVEKTVDTAYYIPAPAINTTYYLYLQADGTFTHNTSGIIPAGAALLWQVAVGATKDALIKTDRRAMISGIAEVVMSHLADNAPHSQYVPQLGASNQIVNLFKALNQQIDTRGVTLTYDTNGRLTTVTERDGTTTVKTTSLGYDANGNLVTVTEQVAGKMITTTLTYDANGNLASIARSVV